MNYTVLLLGSDANAYYMARCYHELYNKKVDLMNKALIGVTEYSSIINFIKVDNVDKADKLVDALNSYAKESKFEKIVLIGTNDKFVRLIVENQSKIDTKFVFNYPTLEIINTLLVKDNFYNAYKAELNLPKTLIYSCESKPKIIDDFKYPIILKPGDGVEYNKHPFIGQSKVYKIKTFNSLLETIKTIEDSGYKKNLIIQEFIPGDDCSLFDAVFYCGKDKKAKLVTFAQIGLQERTNTGVGNCTVLVNGFNEHGYNEDVIMMMKNFVEKIGYQGFAEFDLKYDNRDGSYKIFEINPRQARSSYYLAACGYNLVEYLINDLIHNKTMPFTIIKNKMVLSFVPKSVINKYVTSPALLKEIKTLIKEGKFVRPLHYKKDRGLVRKIYLYLKDINYISKYKKLTW
jgi:D-aspartate ligase